MGFDNIINFVFFVFSHIFRWFHEREGWQGLKPLTIKILRLNPALTTIDF